MKWSPHSGSRALTKRDRPPPKDRIHPQPPAASSPAGERKYHRHAQAIHGNVRPFLYAAFIGARVTLTTSPRVSEGLLLDASIRFAQATLLRPKRARGGIEQTIFISIYRSICFQNHCRDKSKGHFAANTYSRQLAGFFQPFPKKKAEKNFSFLRR